ncbi:division/cell wall cluster transcriptional repressor MraZ [Candidatus Beckwithbacteria bacterium RBG_13_42_9]|uniref:Transcriptional regulator MraZ n=1 Tax=Candidatus Beckwithbacteria bacterium RBG_13_42_9 TaxID=1797457 RepID=A0A1F5E7L5_9BACT|nr:MAG: division/cell wall cluster transcriptional repressor MraZ [Candidatus Beckwithbacteria bacterium RBG_13_42_9]
MFIGNFENNFDLEKGRTALPAKFRRNLGKKVIITAGYEGSLMLVKAEDWEKVVSQITQSSFLSNVSRQTERFLLGSAFDVDLDTQGRFIVPLSLRQYAKLGKEIVFVGVGSRIEIWNKLAWSKQQVYLQENIAQISEKLDEKISNK